MANKKLTALTELTSPAQDDYLYAVDRSDPTDALSGTSKFLQVSGVPITYARTAAETSAAIVPVNYQYEPGNVLRYFTNTTPGTTDAHTGFNNAQLQMRCQTNINCHHRNIETPHRHGLLQTFPEHY